MRYGRPQSAAAAGHSLAHGLQPPDRPRLQVGQAQSFDAGAPPRVTDVILEPRLACIALPTGHRSRLALAAWQARTLGHNRNMAVTLDQIRHRREAIRSVLEARGAINPRLFGSLARGKADEKSDVDILIDFRQPAPEGFAYFGALDQLEQELSRLLGTPVHVTVIDPSSPNGRKILSEALPL